VTCLLLIRFCSLLRYVCCWSAFVLCCISYFSTCLQDRDGNVKSHVRTSDMWISHALRGTKCLLWYVNCDVLTRFGTILLNKLMGTTARNAECRMFGRRTGKHDNFFYTLFPICSTGGLRRTFYGIRSAISQSGSWETYDNSVNIILCWDMARSLVILLNSPVSIDDVFVNIKTCRYYQNLIPVPFCPCLDYGWWIRTDHLDGPNKTD
jgi:hypothetical protein